MTSNESFETYLKLERPTSECDVGPEVLLRREALTIKYDVEGEDGAPVWTVLRFQDAVALRVVPDPSVAEIAVRAYNEVGLIKDSEWLASLMTASRGQLSPSLKHFVVFFDDYGSVETIARECEVASNGQL